MRIPPGVDDGDRIRLPGVGGPGIAGGPPGDLYLQVRVRPHPLFGRSGRDLTIGVPVGVAEAALGAKVKVPMLGGKPVTLRIPAGTQPGQVFRVPSKGVPGPRGQSAGDLLVTVQVVVPRHLTDEQRRGFEALAQVCPPPSRDHLGT